MAVFAEHVVHGFVLIDEHDGRASGTETSAGTNAKFEIAISTRSPERTDPAGAPAPALFGIEGVAV